MAQNNRLPYSREDLVQLITEEKEYYNQYLRLCERYQIPPNQVATTVAKAKMELLQKLLDGKLKMHLTTKTI